MPALAGAWIAPEGGQRISTEVAGERDGLFYSETSYYIEAPVEDEVSLVFTPWVTQDSGQSGLDALRWEVTLAAKIATHRGARAVTALQAGVVWNSDPLDTCAEAQAELRWLGGRSIGQHSFVNIETAERAGDEGCGGERLDLTLGRRFEERWLAMAQLFADGPRFGDASVKAQISLVRFDAEGRGLQIGLRARVDGESAEPALVLGFWGRAQEQR
jgi:hypothetical protein